MKKYTELQDAELMVEIPGGQLIGIVSDVQRGEEREKNFLTVWLITKQKPPEAGQCWVTFNDERYGAAFSDVMTTEEIFKSKLKTIIPSSAFWE